jgi:myo-inositol-1(or 4)-monophosphatase
MSSYATATTIMTSALRKAVKFIIRDYGEILHLQSSAKGTLSFALRTEKRVKEVIYSELESFKKNYEIMFVGDAPSDNASDTENTDAEFRWVVEPLEGLNNFAHGIPLFCSYIALQKKEDGIFKTVVVMVEAPGIEETYFIEVGSGAWNENYSRFAKGRVRMRVSTRKYKNELLFVSNVAKLRAGRVFTGPILDSIFLSCGKIDAIILEENNEIIKDITKLFVEESGGVVEIKAPYISLTNGIVKADISKL